MPGSNGSARRSPDHPIAVRVEVYAERNPADLRAVKVTAANLTYAAIDREGNPRLSAH